MNRSSEQDVSPDATVNLRGVRSIREICMGEFIKIEGEFSSASSAARLALDGYRRLQVTVEGISARDSAIRSLPESKESRRRLHELFLEKKEAELSKDGNRSRFFSLLLKMEELKAVLFHLRLKIVSCEPQAVPAPLLAKYEEALASFNQTCVGFDTLPREI